MKDFLHPPPFGGSRVVEGLLFTTRRSNYGNGSNESSQNRKLHDYVELPL